MREKIDFILQRHCCRSFSNEELKKGDLELLMKAARLAPSAGNCQPWFFYVVENKNIKTKLAQAAFEQMFLADASIVFVVCANPEISAQRYGNRGRNLYCLQDTAAAVENLLITATALELGSCWIGAFDEEQVKKVLDIPKNLRPVAMVPIGPGEIDSPPSRKSQTEIFKVVK